MLWKSRVGNHPLADRKSMPKPIRFAFHQIVLANSIQNLHSDPRLTDAIDDDPRNHFRTPISGTTRLARRAAVHQYGQASATSDMVPRPGMMMILLILILGRLGQTAVRTAKPDSPNSATRPAMAEYVAEPGSHMVP